MVFRNVTLRCSDLGLIEVEAFGAYVRFAAAGAYHYYGVGGSGVGAVITFFYNGAELAFGVAGVVSVAVVAEAYP